MVSHWGNRFRGYGLAVAYALVGAGFVGVVALAAQAHAGALLTSPVKIKGVRWVDGTKEKVRCSAGHTLGLESDRRTLTLAAGDPKCRIAADALSFVFEGTEDVIVARGKARPQRTLVGSEMETAEIAGVLSSIVALARDGTPKKDRGTIAYLIDSGGPVVVFLGSYAARKF